MTDSRRRERILKEHPAVRTLMGPEWRSKWICLVGLVGPQLYLSVATSDLSWPAFVVAAYVVGATLAQGLFLAVHEMAHNLFFHSARHNRLFSTLTNLPIGVPFAVAFRDYHLEHHRSLGVEGVDTDLPTAWERRVVRGPLRKGVWCSLQIVAYAVRPILVRPRPPTRDLVLNVVVQLVFDVWMVSTYGLSPLAWMLLSVLFAGGLHPCAGHFLSEHYGFPHTPPDQETSSYYGPLNRLTWNVGYHNEHHDFPSVPWSRLPTLSRLVPHYRTLAPSPPWSRIVWDFVWSDTTRVRRAESSDVRST